MPIIKDPKMNGTEKEFGFVYDEKKDSHLIYKKKKNRKNRRLVAGTRVAIDKNNITEFSEERRVEGMYVYGEIKGDFDDSTMPEEAPVIDWLRTHGTNDLTNAVLDDITIGSEVPD